MKEPDFGLGGLLAFWNSMKPEERDKLVKNLEAFHALTGSLKGRKIIETDKNMSKIFVLKRDKDVKRLKELHKAIGARGVEIIEKPKTKRA